MEILLYVLLGLVGLWLVWRLLGGVIGLVYSPFARRERNSTTGQAIFQAVEATGRFDGSVESRQRAYDAFVDLAGQGPFGIDPRLATIEEIATDFLNGLSPSSEPILLEAALTVIGAHRQSYPDEMLATTAKERDQDLAASSLLITLFPAWVKKHQVGTAGALREQKLRFALMTWLLLDKCRREGLLPEGDADVSRR